jgi:hypothetical protein
MPDYHVLEEEVRRYPSMGMVHGVISVPATFTPGQRTGQSIFD